MSSFQFSFHNCRSYYFKGGYNRTYGSNTDGSFTTAFLTLSSVSKNPKAADIIEFGINSSDLLFHIDKVRCVYSLESRR